MKKIVFLGSDPIALPLLNYLWEHASDLNYTLSGIISQPDRPSGRGKKVKPNPLSEWALERELPLFRPDKPSDVEYNWMKEEGMDLALVMAYGHILKQRFLDLPPLGMLNFHASILPAYRGASPIESAIANGEHKTGVSLMQMVLKMDAGGVMDIEEVGIVSQDTSESLRSKISEACVPLIRRNLVSILDGELNFREQDETQATYTRKIKKEDGWLDFNAPAVVLERRIRALTPWPGGFFKLEGLTIKIGSAEVVLDVSTNSPGRVMDQDKDGLTIATGEGGLKLTHLQKPGGRMIPAPDFLRGHPIPIGTLLEGNANMAPLVLS